MITSSPITFLSIAAEGICRKRLLAAGLDNLLDVAMHESSGSCGYLVVKIKKRSDEDFDKIMARCGSARTTPRILLLSLGGN